MSGGSGAQRFRSPLRYPGGKGKIANYLKLIILSNELMGCDYVEPYAGGAGAALSLLFEEYVGQIHINDIDPGVYAFWRVATEEPEALTERILDVDVDMAEWRRQRQIRQIAPPASVDMAFATFFLNRTNRSGIITGGPIGGPEQAGTWRLDARFNRLDLIRRIERVARFRSRIVVSSVDAIDLIAEYSSTSGHATTLLYADPPYYVKGSELYRDFYGPDDHAAISAAIQDLDSPWVVSYDNVQPILDLYSESACIEYSLSYSAARRYRGSEVMFVSPGLALPSVESPANIPSKQIQAALVLP